MFVIYKQGVYGHGVWGLYKDLADAISDCQILSDIDRDDYHTWEVREVPVGKPYRDDGFDGYDKTVYSCKKLMS